MIELKNETHQAVKNGIKVSSVKKSSLYNLGASDRKNGFYFLVDGLKVPFKAVLMENNKVEGIASVAFGSARNCPSLSLGLCQLPEDRLCYARAGERRATRKENGDGSKGMDSFLKGELSSIFWDAYESDLRIQEDFHRFLRSKGIETLRFNLKGDFRHEGDILAIHNLAKKGFKLTGYTARDDLHGLETLGNHPNIILNGSNKKYTNRFKATDSLEEFLSAKFPCRGKCGACGNCYKLRGETITVLIHGNGSDTLLNTPENQQFILEWSKEALPWDVLRDCDFNTSKGFVTCLNKELKRVGVILRFKNVKDLIQYMRRIN